MLWRVNSKVFLWLVLELKKSKDSDVDPREGISGATIKVKLQSSIPRIAVMNSIGDFSFNSYCWHLLESMGAYGFSIDLYTNAEPGVFCEIPEAKAHRRHLLWGSFIRPKSTLPPADASVKMPAQSTPSGRQQHALVRESWWRAKLRPALLTHQTLWMLRQQGTRIFWTQWPEPEPYLPGLWNWAKRYGMLTVHTVHNVLPHEVRPGDRERYGRVYESADLLLVHSEEARARLLREYPALDPAKTLMHRMGLYEVYPRHTGQRETLRKKWGIGEDCCVMLVCGLIRPYKNVDAVIEAFEQCGDSRAILVIGGKEMGFPDSDPANPLKRTQAMIRQRGLSQRVRLIPGYFSASDMSGLLEASDVLLLPYKEGYGSGLLLLGMTFGKLIVTTLVGGAEEYLENYEGKVLLPDADVGAIVRAWTQVIRNWERLAKASESGVWVQPPKSLQWSEVVRPLAAGLEQAWKSKHG